MLISPWKQRNTLTWHSHHAWETKKGSSRTQHQTLWRRRTPIRAFWVQRRDHVKNTPAGSDGVKPASIMSACRHTNSDAAAEAG